ncbi:MAG: universal stress protein [Candidatus Dormibacteraeota bacterium]|nr:universal stress protein [Candidatus Dormibacteraeota bacterium]
MADTRVKPIIATSRMLVAVEAVPEATAVIAAAVQMATRSGAEVVVLSVREREVARGLAWDVRPPAELAEVLSRAIYQLQRAGVQARGIIRMAPTGRVAEAIVDAAHRHQADQIIVGSRRRTWLGAWLSGSVAPRVVRLSDLPVVAVPLKRAAQRSGAAPNR